MLRTVVERGNPRDSPLDPMIPNDGVEVLAQQMIKHFPANAADQTALRSTAFFHMGYADMSKKWLLVRAEIKKMLAGVTVSAD